MAKGGKFNVEVDDTLFKKNAKKFLLEIGIEEKDFIKEQSGLLARDLARFTPPYASFPVNKGTSIGKPADIRAGKFAVFYDIIGICHPRKRSAINWAKKNFGNGYIYANNVKIGKGVIENIGDLSNWHHQNRNRRGRTKRIPDSEQPFVLKTVFNKYYKRRQKDVGIAKASFYKASLAFDAKGSAPPNVKKNLGKSAGLGIMRKTDKGWVGNISGTSKGAADTLRHLPQIQFDREKRAMARLKYIVNALMKKSFV